MGDTGNFWRHSSATAWENPGESLGRSRKVLGRFLPSPGGTPGRRPLGNLAEVMKIARGISRSSLGCPRHDMEHKNAQEQTDTHTHRNTDSRG